VDLSQIEILVLDEADRMLDMGFIRDIRKILALMPAPGQRQTLMFSATFSSDIKALSRQMLHDPKLIEVAAQNKTADKIKQKVHLVNKSQKRELLSEMISSNNWSQVLVFTRTKHGANKLADQLSKDGLETAAIHGNKSQGARTRALAEFKSGKTRVLVATDIAARGLDIEQLPHVVNYELPNVPEDYVHRIGRTARAGHSGEAVSLVSADELSFLRDIERLVKQKIEQVKEQGFTSSQPAAKQSPKKPISFKKPSSRRSSGRNKSGNGSGKQNNSSARHNQQRRRAA
jgi:ATP-dependent RNA helicase RhlE